LALLVATDWTEFVGGGHYENFMLQQLGSLVDDLFHQLFETTAENLVGHHHHHHHHHHHLLKHVRVDWIAQVHLYFPTMS
jgi:hypothetical protein